METKTTKLVFVINLRSVARIIWTAKWLMLS